MDKNELSKSTGSASSFLSKIKSTNSTEVEPSSKKRSFLKAASPQESAKEKVRILFRCSTNGGRFAVLFESHDPAQKFIITNIIKQDKKDPERRSAKSRAGKSDIIWTPYNDKPDPVEKEQESVNYSADRLDWADWYCPYCMVKDEFVRCGRCKCFVCFSRSEKRSDGELFRCYEECGYEGMLGGGTIGSYENSDAPEESSKDLSGGGQKRLDGGPAGFLE
ncbi:MAG: hypothetical protein ACSHX0_13265 [Akkermansiaceae bacterium]